MNIINTFILTASILVTSAFVVGLSAAQPADAKKTTIYCTDFPEPYGPFCGSSLAQCEDRRADLRREFSVSSEPCHAERVKVDKH